MKIKFREEVVRDGDIIEIDRDKIVSWPKVVYLQHPTIAYWFEEVEEEEQQ